MTTISNQRESRGCEEYCCVKYSSQLKAQMKMVVMRSAMVKAGNIAADIAVIPAAGGLLQSGPLGFQAIALRSAKL